MSFATDSRSGEVLIFADVMDGGIVIGKMSVGGTCVYWIVLDCIVLDLDWIWILAILILDVESYGYHSVMLSPYSTSTGVEYSTSTCV